MSEADATHLVFDALLRKARQRGDGRVTLDFGTPCLARANPTLTLHIGFLELDFPDTRALAEWLTRP